MTVAREASKRLGHSGLRISQSPQELFGKQWVGTSKSTTQINVAATEPQVPGPGLKVPTPKKVPTIHAQVVRPDGCTASANLVIALGVDPAAQQLALHRFLIYVCIDIRVEDG